jgi:hypothetical protein
LGREARDHHRYTVTTDILKPLLVAG